MSALRIGRVLGAQGLKGELRIRLFRADPRYFDAHRIQLNQEHAVENVRWIDARTAVVGVRGVEDRTAAEALIGAEVGIDLAWFKANTAPSEVLIGRSAIEEGTGRVLGVVEGLDDNGAQTLLLVRTESGNEVQVPLVDALVREAEDGVLHIQALPGLFEP